MKKLALQTSFLCALRSAIRPQPELRARIEHVLGQLAEDPFHPRLHSHKLKGELAGTLAVGMTCGLRQPHPL